MLGKSTQTETVNLRAGSARGAWLPCQDSPGPRQWRRRRGVPLALTMPLSLPPPPHCTWCVCVPAAPRMAPHPAHSPGGAARPGAQRRAGACGCSVRPCLVPPPAPAHARSPVPTLPGPCLMDESWFVTPPPCFTAEEPGPDGVGSSPMEDLLIEHPSMSVYVTSTLELDAEEPQDSAAG